MQIIVLFYIVVVYSEMVSLLMLSALFSKKLSTTVKNMPPSVFIDPFFLAASRYHPFHILYLN
jgi:hypothetical protein